MGCVVQHACGHLVPSPVELTAVAGPHLMPSTQLPRVVLHTVAVEYEHQCTCVLSPPPLPPLPPPSLPPSRAVKEEGEGGGETA